MEAWRAFSLTAELLLRKGQISLRYPAREPACELVRELDSIMEFGLKSARMRSVNQAARSAAALCTNNQAMHFCTVRLITS